MREVSPDDVALRQDLEATPFRWYLPERFNIAAACLDPHPADGPALIVDNLDGQVHRYSFGDITALSARLVAHLTVAGVTPGDRVAIMNPQSMETAVAHMACYRAGAIAVPLSVKFGADAIVYRLQDSGAVAAVMHGSAFSRIADRLDQVPALTHVVLVDGDGRYAGAAPTVVPFPVATGDGDASGDFPDTALDDPALLIYTSGTTGPAKGALHAHRVLLAHLPGFRRSQDDYPFDDDVFWTPADWAWAGGLLDSLLPTWLCGRPIVASTARFTPAMARTLMVAHRVTNAFIPPTALKQMRRSDEDFSGASMRAIASGGEVVGEAISAWSRQALGVTPNELYGQTEANLTIGTCHARFESPPGSMGRATPGFDIELLDADGVPVPAGEVGEIAVALPNPGVILEYWNRPEQTREKRGGAFLRTGDLARRDEDGFFWFEGRADDIISTAGYRVGPGEVEEVLLQHEAVLMVAVVGLPDELRGEAVTAFVVLNPGHEPSDVLTVELQDLVKGNLASYQYPRQIVYRDHLPTTTTGKIQRAELRTLDV